MPGTLAVSWLRCGAAPPLACFAACSRSCWARSAVAHAAALARQAQAEPPTPLHAWFPASWPLSQEPRRPSLFAFRRLPVSQHRPSRREPSATARAHQIVGFLPDWEVGSFTPDYRDLTTLIYWSVSLAKGGAISHSGQGWSTLGSNALALDIMQAHAAGDRVLLTVFSEDPSVIHSVAAHATLAGRRLAKSVGHVGHRPAISTGWISTSKETARRTGVASSILWRRSRTR